MIVQLVSEVPSEATIGKECKDMPSGLKIGNSPMKLSDVPIYLFRTYSQKDIQAVQLRYTVPTVDPSS